eukprot:349711-Prymnesium_polylepis.1
MPDIDWPDVEWPKLRSPAVALPDLRLLLQAGALPCRDVARAAKRVSERGFSIPMIGLSDLLEQLRAKLPGVPWPALPSGPNIALPELRAGANSR